MNTLSPHIKILALVPYKVFPAIMGGQKGIALFYKYLSQQVVLNVITTQKNEAKESYSVKNILTNSQVRYISPSIFFLLKKEAEQTKSTHLLFEHPYYAWLIVLFKRFTSYKIIVHSHNIESERFKSVGKWWWKMLWYYERMAYRAAHHVWFKTKEDQYYAMAKYGVKESQTQVVPYGIEQDHMPSSSELQSARDQICRSYEIAQDEVVMLFNGTLNYKPNLDALQHILQDILPLLKESGKKFRILICGKNLPVEMNELKSYSADGVIYAGFVEDIDLYFKACDIFLNPLLDGGGIKTKLVEALGFGKPSVSTVNGAIGVDAACTQGRLSIVDDYDWKAFAKAVISHMESPVSNDNTSYYNIFSWKHIAQNAVLSLSQ